MDHIMKYIFIVYLFGVIKLINLIKIPTYNNFRSFDLFETKGVTNKLDYSVRGDVETNVILTYH